MALSIPFFALHYNVHCQAACAHRLHTAIMDHVSSAFVSCPLTRILRHPYNAITRHRSLASCHGSLGRWYSTFVFAYRRLFLIGSGRLFYRHGVHLSMCQIVSYAFTRHCICRAWRSGHKIHGHVAHNVWHDNNEIDMAWYGYILVSSSVLRHHHNSI